MVLCIPSRRQKTGARSSLARAHAPTGTHPGPPQPHRHTSDTESDGHQPAPHGQADAGWLWGEEAPAHGRAPDAHVSPQRTGTRTPARGRSVSHAAHVTTATPRPARRRTRPAHTPAPLWAVREKAQDKRQKKKRHVWNRNWDEPAGGAHRHAHVRPTALRRGPRPGLFLSIAPIGGGEGEAQGRSRAGSGGGLPCQAVSGS